MPQNSEKKYKNGNFKTIVDYFYILDILNITTKNIILDMYSFKLVSLFTQG